MDIIRKFSLTLTPNQVADAIGRGKSCDALAEDIDWALDQIGAHWQPAAAVGYFPVTSMSKGRARVGALGSDSGIELDLGPLSYLLDEARQVQIACATIGPVIDEKVQAVSRQGDTLRAFVLDSVGVLSLGEIGRAIREKVEAEAVSRGWGVGPSLGPGSLKGWALEEQQVLCSLLPLQDIGVRLGLGCTMRPLKSATSVIGIGPGYPTQRVGSVCQYCMHYKNCWRRRRD